ncbi:MAG: beta-lactamase class, partial [Thermoleophilia bacterium]|nr:beta-lactamase class [Thermoleophilia bacterium]
MTIIDGSEFDVPESDPTAWTRPGVEELADGAWRIPLPLPIDGLSTVNAYLFTGGADAVLVDPGWATRESAEALRIGLADIGRDVSDVTRILATHTHFDHYSHALELRTAHGTPVAIGAGERQTIEGYSYGSHFYRHQVDLLEVAGAPQLAQEILAWQPEWYEIDLPFEPPSDWLEDGWRIPVGDRELTVIATP